MDNRLQIVISALIIEDFDVINFVFHVTVRKLLAQILQVSSC